MWHGESPAPYCSSVTSSADPVPTRGSLWTTRTIPDQRSGGRYFARAANECTCPARNIPAYQSYYLWHSTNASRSPAVSHGSHSPDYRHKQTPAGTAHLEIYIESIVRH